MNKVGDDIIAHGTRYQCYPWGWCFAVIFFLNNSLTSFSQALFIFLILYLFW